VYKNLPHLDMKFCLYFAHFCLQVWMYYENTKNSLIHSNLYTEMSKIQRKLYIFLWKTFIHPSHHLYTIFYLWPYEKSNHFYCKTYNYANHALNRYSMMKSLLQYIIHVESDHEIWYSRYVCSLFALGFFGGKIFYSFFLLLNFETQVTNQNRKWKKFSRLPLWKNRW
jgi:hypothetical protein